MESTSVEVNKYCIAIDGSECSNWAFDLVFSELYRKGDKVVLVHITNPAKLSEIPFAFQPETIISKYDAKLTGKLLKADYQIIKQDRSSNSVHALAQVNQLAVTNNCTVLVMGFRGSKGDKSNKSELTKGITYIMGDVKIPVIVVKEKLERKSKENSAFTWMATIENAQSRSFKTFTFAINFVNTNLDKVIGTHINDKNQNLAKEVKELFEGFCQKKEVQNYSYQCIDKPKDVDTGTQISNLVNFNDNDVIDFIIVGHNPNKYSSDNRNLSPLHQVIQTAQSNILFYS